MKNEVIDWDSEKIEETYIPEIGDKVFMYPNHGHSEQGVVEEIFLYACDPVALVNGRHIFLRNLAPRK